MSIIAAVNMTVRPSVIHPLQAAFWPPLQNNGNLQKHSEQKQTLCLVSGILLLILQRGNMKILTRS